MAKIFLVSNRLPVSVEKRKGKLFFRSSVGGLVTGIEKFHQSRGSQWIGWPGIASDKISAGEEDDVRAHLAAHYRCHPVFLSQQEVEGYYHGFGNSTLWPLFHYFPQFTEYDAAEWHVYRTVNERFRDVLRPQLKPHDTVWIHDYHLLLLPQLLRDEFPDLSIGFFLHIPFPSFEMLRLMPWHAELLKGMLGADLIGFHTYDYVLHFLQSIQRALGVSHEMGHVTIGERITKVDALPLGIDHERFTEVIKKRRVRQMATRLRKEAAARKVILSIDRLDYTKGIAQRLHAFRTFLKRYPEYREKVTLILVVVPSRTRVDNYRRMKQEIDELVGNINGAYGMLDWTPVRYFYRSLEFEHLVSLYVLADVALITPLRDGMNLTAKEYIAAKGDGGHGVLILSEMAGAAKELSEALFINPYSEEEMVDSLRKALSMPDEEQRRRNNIMQQLLSKRNTTWWADEFLDRLEQVKRRSGGIRGIDLTPLLRTQLVRDFFKAKRRLIFLDYDGTLAPFSARPEEAKPHQQLILLLDALARDESNEVVIVSGRSKENIDAWFGYLDIGLIAEHGVWLRRRGGEWISHVPAGSGWKEDVERILAQYTSLAPGSFIEEKDFSLVWHYRQVNQELGIARSRELLGIITELVQNLPLIVMSGNKVIEVKAAGVAKGVAAQEWLKEKWGFIFAAGDDVTDETLFKQLPAVAYSVKVGDGTTSARLRVEDHRDILALLMSFTKKEGMLPKEAKELLKRV